MLVASRFRMTGQDSTSTLQIWVVRLICEKSLNWLARTVATCALNVVLKSEMNLRLLSLADPSTIMMWPLRWWLWSSLEDVRERYFLHVAPRCTKTAPRASHNWGSSQSRSDSRDLHARSRQVFRFERERVFFRRQRCCWLLALSLYLSEGTSLLW